MMVRSVSHIFPAGDVQRPQPAGGVAQKQVMGTPAHMTRHAEKAEATPEREVVQYERPSPAVSAATHDAVTRLSVGG